MCVQALWMLPEHGGVCLSHVVDGLKVPVAFRRPLELMHAMNALEQSTRRFGNFMIFVRKMRIYTLVVDNPWLYLAQHFASRVIFGCSARGGERSSRGRRNATGTFNPSPT